MNAIRGPISIADPSHIVDFCLRRNFWIRNSNKTQEAIDVNITIKAPNPKNTRDVIRAGIKAITTPYISPFSVLPLCICGANNTFCFFSIFN